jgi:acyl-CoA dehydrogenase
MRTRAIKDGHEYVINGSKTFISNGVLADLVVLAVKTDPAAGAKGITLFLIENGTPGFSKGRQIPKVGLHAQDTIEMFFEDCRVPAENMLGGEGNGFKCLMSKLQQERLMVAVSAQASAERCLELTLNYVKERKLFGKSLSQFQNTQFTLAEIASEIQVGRSFVDQLILNHMAHKDIVYAGTSEVMKLVVSKGLGL